jgi:hypothetical protein
MSLTPPVGYHDHIQGSIGAPVTLVEYGDYECLFCGEIYPVIRAVQDMLGDRLCLSFATSRWSRFTLMPNMQRNSLICSSRQPVLANA